MFMLLYQKDYKMVQMSKNVIVRPECSLRCSLHYTLNTEAVVPHL